MAQGNRLISSRATEAKDAPKGEESATMSIQEYNQAIIPLDKVHGSPMARYKSRELGLGLVDFICLRGTSNEAPAMCQYTGNMYFSEDWHMAH